MNYDDIISMPYPALSKRPRMPMSDRAAQFSPFAALTGYDEQVKETVKLAEELYAMAERWEFSKGKPETP